MIISLVPKGNSVAKLAKILGEKSVPNLTRAVRRAANITLRGWVRAVEESNAKPGWKREYQKKINIESQNNPLEAKVSAEGKFVSFVEDGIKRFDMKPGLLNSPKAKVNKKGEPYIIVSFRHGAPTSQHVPPMPREIHSLMQKVEGSLLPQRIRGIPGLEDYEIPGKYKGMIKVGRRGHEQYRTFRIVTKKSRGWMYPGAPAVPIFNKVKQSVRNEINKEVKEGLIKDLRDEVDKLL